MKKGEFDWWEQNVTSEIYINTHRSDWWKACEKIAELIQNSRSLIDVGGGDGHTLWQILSATLSRGARLNTVAFVEPSAAALKLAKQRLEQLPIRQLKLYKGTLESLGSKLLADKSYDVLYAGHANYYFGKQTGGRYSLEKYQKSLTLLPRLARTVLVMTVPKKSDYYQVVSKNPFSEWVYSEAVVQFYRSRGYTVRVIKMPMRFYVAHAQQSKHEAIILWKFFHDTSLEPSAKELSQFLSRLSKKTDTSGHINFMDELVVVSGKK
jgi:hypothetical protein